MASIENQIKAGKRLLNSFHKLDSKIIDQQLTQDKFTRDTLISDINYFKKEAEKYTDDTQDFVDSKKIHLNSREHEYVNDEEVYSPALRDFYSYGITVEQIIKKLKALKNGSPKDRPKQDGKFHYIAKDKILCRNNDELRIRSQDFKSESIFEVVFENAPKWVLAIDIGDRQEEKSGHAGDISNDPYKWIRPACTRLNKKIRCRFEVEFDLFEKGEQQVKLNSKAM